MNGGSGTVSDITVTKYSPYGEMEQPQYEGYVFDGWYTKKEQKVLLLMAKRSESNSIFRLVKNIDPNAFVSQANVVGVYGKGFDRLR